MSPAKKNCRRPRSLRWIWITAAVVIVLPVLLLFFLRSPLFLHYVVLPVLGRNIECRISARSISYSFFAGKLTAKGLRISDGEKLLFRAEDVMADLSMLSLLAGKWDIETAMLRDAELSFRIPKDSAGKADAAGKEIEIPLAAEKMIPVCIQNVVIRDFSLFYQDESGPQPVFFRTTKFSLQIHGWGVPNTQSELRGSCPFSLHIPGSASLRGGRAELALNTRFDGEGMPRDFSLSLGAGCLASLIGEKRELPQNLILRTRGSFDRSGKVMFDAFSLQQHTGGEITAYISGSGSFGPEPDDFSIRIDQFRTLSQFWDVVPPLFGHQPPGRFTLAGAGEFAQEGGFRNCSFHFSGSRASEKDFPGITFSCRGSLNVDPEKKRTHFSSLSLDVKETEGKGVLTVRLARPMDYHWETGLGGAVVNGTIRKMPLTILRGAFRNRGTFPVRSGECSGTFRALVRKDLGDIGGSGMLSLSRVVLCHKGRDFAPLNSEFLVDWQFLKLKKFAGSVQCGGRRILKFSLHGECGKDYASGSLAGKGSADAEALLRFFRHEKMPIGSSVRTDFTVKGSGGDKKPLHLQTELNRIPFRIIELPDGCRAESGTLQATLTLSQKSSDAPKRFRFAVRGNELKFQHGKTRHQWERARIEGNGEMKGKNAIRMRGSASAENRKKRFFEFTVEDAECFLNRKTLKTEISLRHCDLGMLPISQKSPVTQGTLQGKAALSLGPEQWKTETSLQAKALSGPAGLPADGRAVFKLSGSRKQLELHSLSLDFQSRGEKVLALTGSGKLDTSRRGRIKVDSSIMDMDFLKKFCIDAALTGKTAVPDAAAASAEPCQIKNRFTGDVELNFRKVCIGRSYGTLQCRAQTAPGNIRIRSYALSFNGVPVHGNAQFSNAKTGVLCQFAAKSDRPMELRPILQFFIPESLQGMRCRMEKMQLLCRGVLPQWEQWREYLHADLNAGFGECVVPNSFGKWKIGRIILLPFEAINRLRAKTSVDDKNADDSFLHTMQGFQRSVKTIRFSRGIAEVKLRRGSLHVQQFQFKGGLVNDFRINGTIQLIGKRRLDLQTNTTVSGMDFPIRIGGTVENPEVQSGKTTTDIVVKNTGNLLKSLKDKVDWDTTLQ